MGVQLSDSPTWHPVSSVLEVIWGLPEFVSTGHGLHCWWHMSTLGPVVVAQQVVDSGHLHPPPSPTWSVCSHCYDIFNEDYLICSWYLHVWNRVAVARNPPTCPAEKRSLGENLVNDRWIECSAQVRLCTERKGDSILFEISPGIGQRADCMPAKSQVILCFLK